MIALPLSRLSRALWPLTAAAMALTLAACGGDETVIKNKIQMELDACKASTEPLYPMKTGAGDPYPVIKEFCEQPIGEFGITEQIYATVPVGPYKFKLRKNTSDGRWHLNQVSWPEMDDVRNTLTWDTISDSDYQAILKKLATAEGQAPKLEEIKETRLDILLKLRRKAKKDDDPDPGSLGKEGEAYYKAALAAASEQDNPNLAAKLRLRVIQYYDGYRQIAEDYSTPNEQGTEYEAAAIKALQIEVEEAEKKGDEALKAKKEADIEERKKEMAANIEQRVKDAERMGKLAVMLKARECSEIQAIRTVNPRDAAIQAQVADVGSLVNCP